MNVKRKLGVIAVLAALPVLAIAQSNIPRDPWVFYPDNRVSEKAAEAPRVGKSATIPVDTWVFYPDNRFSDQASASGRQIGAGVASAADWSAQVQQGSFGSAAQSRPDSTIKIRSTTGTIYVDHLKTAKIENDRGQSFTWQFDGLMSMSAFPLKLIAPSGFDAGNVQVSVLHPAHHTAP